MAPQITIITGCSSGIGLSLAVKLARDSDRQYLVYATMRNLAKKGVLEEEAGSALNDTLFIRELDVTKDDQVRSVCREIAGTHGRIDVLVNNAGFGYSGQLEDMPIDQVKGIFDTNFFGTVRMTQEVLKGMKQRRSGRIVNISSLFGHQACPFYDIYCCTKYAMEGLTESLYAQLKVFNVHVSSIQPGPVLTKFFENLATGTPPQDSDKTTENGCDDDNKMMMGFMKILAKEALNEVQQSGDVIRVITECLQAESPKLRYPTSDTVKAIFRARYADGIGCAGAVQMEERVSTAVSNLTKE